MPAISAPVLSIQDDHSAGFVGRKTITANLDFRTAGVNVYTLDMSQYQSNNTFGIPKTLAIDNSTNPNSVSVSVTLTGQTFPVPPYSAGNYALSAIGNSALIFSSSGGATGLTNIQVLNYQIEPSTWTGFSPIVPGYQVEALPMIATTWTARNAILAGAAAATRLFPAVVNPRECAFKNIGDPTGATQGEAVYWQLGVDPTGVFANGDQLLNVGETVVMPFRTINFISFFAPTAAVNTYIQGYEVVRV